MTVPTLSTDNCKSGDPVSPQDGPELVIGIVAPVGSNLELVCRVLESELTKFNYSSHIIHLSKLLSILKPYEGLDQENLPSEYERVDRYMDVGTELRKKTNRGDIMSFLAVSKIREIRETVNSTKGNEGGQKPLHRTAFILRSLKHPDEIRTLKSVYGPAFILISAYAPREKRIETLSAKIASTGGSTNVKAHRGKAEELLSRDEREQGTELGQNVSTAFPVGELFVDTETRDKVVKFIRRYLELFFNFPFHTPSKDENGMFHAKAAALRSADLSRQVGAAIVTREGEIVSSGCNEVPKAFGGSYWEGDAGDDRDFRRGYDSNAKFKINILSEIMDRLKKGGWLAVEKSDRKASEMIEDLLQGTQGAEGILRETQIVSLLEFGRPVHAEMDALITAARRGISVKDCTLYTTTFPCHICARHIIGSGIRRVVYVEPYPKSVTKDLYSDSATIDSPDEVIDKVRFEQFVGIAPARYLDLFELQVKRKDAYGVAIEWEKSKANPQFKRYALSYLMIEEDMVGKVFPKILEKNNIELAGN